MVNNPAWQAALPQIHPARDELYSELHARPFPVLSSPLRITHLALQLDEHEKEADFAHLQQLCANYGVHPPKVEDNSFYQHLGDLTLRWEKHLEFVTYTFIRSGASAKRPFTQTALDLLPPSWLAAIPGQLVAGFHVEVLTAPQPALTREELAECFEGQRLVQAQLMEGASNLWSAFRLHGDGLGRILLHNQDLNSNQTGRLIVRVLELETYRLMALLGAKPARDLANKLRPLDQKLAYISSQLVDADDPSAERELLDELTLMAAKLEGFSADTLSRFAATQAYYKLVMRRLEELQELDAGPTFTLQAFFTRRLTPAVHTCETTSQRLDDLANRVKRTSDLIRTRVDLKLEEQNKRLLASMNRRSRIQLRMQETVEGLSIAAISYYGVSLLSYIFTALEPLGLPLTSKQATAASVPIMLVTIWWLTRRIKKLIVEASDPNKEP